MTFEIVPATDADRLVLRDLHRDSWASAYASMVPPEALGAPLEDHMTRTWAALPDGILIARDGARAVGFIRLKYRLGWPYIDNLHVAPNLRGGGAGRALMAAGCEVLRSRDAGRVWLTVVSANVGARRFYRRMGGYEGASMREVLLGVEVATYPVVWTRLGHLSECSN